MDFLIVHFLKNGCLDCPVFVNIGGRAGWATGGVCLCRWRLGCSWIGKGAADAATRGPVRARYPISYYVNGVGVCMFSCGGMVSTGPPLGSAGYVHLPSAPLPGAPSRNMELQSDPGRKRPNHPGQ